MLLFSASARVFFLAAALSWAGAAAVASSSSSPRVAVIHADHGNVTFMGKAVEADGVAVDAFLGIRYANPEMERFAPSELLLGPHATDIVDGVVNATVLGPWCAQASQPFGGSANEDCLFLNVWRPSLSSGNALPVMVWIHGGAMSIDSASNPWYDGTLLAGTENVVVVTLNYRLGVFGFLPTGADGMGGMNGLLDQVQALEWVKHSISFFGGDPDKVTIFGESAGSQLVCLLSVCPRAKGLFHRAILESGQCISESMYGRLLKPEQAEEGVKKLLKTAGVQNVEALKNLTTEELLQSSNGAVFLTWDRSVIPASPKDLYSDPAGLINPTDMIIGANTFDDAGIFGTPAADYINMAAQLESTVRDQFGEEEAKGVLSAYSPNRVYNNSQVKAYAQFQGDFQRLCFSRELAAMASPNIEGRVYSFIFGHLSSGDPALNTDLLATAGIDDPAWSSHGADLQFVFGNLAPHAVPTVEDTALGREIRARWANFARSGNPVAFSSSNASSLAEWDAVPKDLDADGEGASDLPYLFLTVGGGMPVVSNEAKTGQCATIVRADSSLGINRMSGTDQMNGCDRPCIRLPFMCLACLCLWLVI